MGAKIYLTCENEVVIKELHLGKTTNFNGIFKKGSSKYDNCTIHI